METEDDIRKMAADHIYSTVIKYYFGLLVIPVCVYMAFTTEDHQTAQRAWLFALWAIAAAILPTLHSLKSASKAQLWRFKFRTALPLMFLICGTLWAFAPFLFDEDSSSVDTAYLFVLCIGFISAVIIPGILWNSLFYSLAGPILASLLLKLILETHINYLWLALSVVLYIYVMIDGVSKQRKLVIFSIQMQKENETLIKDLEKQKELAEFANNNKTRFLAAASHDLRQPLHAIGLFCDALRSKVGNSASTDLVDQIKDAAASSNSYLSVLLDISKLDAGAFEPRLQSLDIKTLLEKITSEFAPQAKIKGLNFNLQAAQYWIRSDPVFLEVILRNLVSNALRYTYSGSVTLRCEGNTDEVKIFVIDTGIGISQEHHEEIFREFWQLDNPERDSTKGFGLGLSTVDRFCRYLNIDLSLTSALNQGSTFMLALPRSSPADSVVTAQKGASTACPVVDLTVLLLENHKDSRVATTHLLTSWGYKVFASDSLVSAQSDYLSKGVDPDIVLADFGLSNEISGIDALSKLAGLAKKPFVGIIVTGESSPQGLEKLRRCDHRVLFKPVSAVKMRSALVSAGAELGQMESDAAL